MLYRGSVGAIALAAALTMTIAGSRAHDESTYPDLKGQWIRADAGPSPKWDPAGQQAPLTPEYQALFQASLAKRAQGGLDGNTTCLPPGMPRSMIAYDPIEIIIMPDTTYMMLSYMSEFRRIFTDGRKWPEDLEPSYTGYSIGKWEDTDGDGRLDTLVVETRGMKGPRTFDGSGLPLHKDNETVIKERISLDKANPNLLHNEITTIDHALTRPWTVTRDYRRERDAVWNEYVCSEDNRFVLIGDETYRISDDGYLLPTRKDQAPPDLRYFPNKK
ncbi:MAG: hypothetical protein QOC56_2042 [Alphaproteobacteria bacterium]|jgi:hypothetical protein|nr:hypothetical protein [Alphaproteobacteria bacterium]